VHIYCSVEKGRCPLNGALSRMHCYSNNVIPSHKVVSHKALYSSCSTVLFATHVNVAGAHHMSNGRHTILQRTCTHQVCMCAVHTVAQLRTLRAARLKGAALALDRSSSTNSSSTRQCNPHDTQPQHACTAAVHTYKHTHCSTQVN
jgi:hypothetical protein